MNNIYTPEAEKQRTIELIKESGANTFGNDPEFSIFTDAIGEFALNIFETGYAMGQKHAKSNTQE